MKKEKIEGLMDSELQQYVIGDKEAEALQHSKISSSGIISVKSTKSENENGFDKSTKKRSSDKRSSSSSKSKSSKKRKSLKEWILTNDQICFEHDKLWDFVLKSKILVMFVVILSYNGKIDDDTAEKFKAKS